MVPCRNLWGLVRESVVVDRRVTWRRLVETPCLWPTVMPDGSVVENKSDNTHQT